MQQIQTSLTSIAGSIVNFINGVAVPLVFALAFIIFLWGVFRYYFVKYDKPEARKEGQQFMMWGIIAFAVMVSVWGLVNLVTGTFWLDNRQPNLPTFNLNGGNTANGTGSLPGTNNAAGGSGSLQGTNNASNSGSGSLPGTNNAASPSTNSPAPNAQLETAPY